MIASTDSVTSQLSQLEQAALVRRAESSFEMEYLFKHGLVQETAYDSLLRNDRKRLHRFVAETLEEDVPRQGERAPTLARHWEFAGEPARAFTYYLRAGQEAARVFANPEALMAYDHAFELASELSMSHDVAQSLYAGRGRVLELQSDFAAALANYEAEELWAVQSGHSAMELDALIRRATVYATPSNLLDFEQGVLLSKRALERARAAGDRAAEAKVLWNLLLSHFFANKNEQAVVFGEASVAIARELNLSEQLAYSLNDVARSYLFVGRAAEGRAAMQEAQLLWRELENLPMLADNLIGFGMASFLAGDYQSERRRIEEGFRIAQEIGNIWGQAYAQEVLGMLHFMSGEFEQALSHSLQAAELGAQVNFIEPKVTGTQICALINQTLGAPNIALSMLDPVVEIPSIAPIAIIVTDALRGMMLADLGDFARARTMFEGKIVDMGDNFSIEQLLIGMARTYVLLAQGQFDAALSSARAVVAELDASDMRPVRSTMLLYQALALEQMGQLDDAVRAAEEARTDATATSERNALWLILAALARIYAARGESEQASRLRQDARREVQFIVDHAPTQLVESFLNRPQVQGLMEQVPTTS